MASLHHEILVELFRGGGTLAVELLRACAGITVEHARVELGSADLSQLAPIEYRADAVVILRDAAEQPVSGVIVEIQRQIDRTKLRTWPVYVTVLRAQLDCDAVLLVVAPRPEVAAWARRPIELGHPGFRLTPIVVDFENAPRVRDRVEARRSPELAVLAAIAHPELETAEHAIGALDQLPAEHAKLYFDVIMAALPAAARQALESSMQRYEYQSDFARKYYGQGLEEGRQEGRQEGHQEGRQDGLRAAALALARSKLDAVSALDLDSIEATSDQVILTELITALGEARDGGEARAALARVLDRAQQPR